MGGFLSSAQPVAPRRSLPFLVVLGSGERSLSSYSSSRRSSDRRRSEDDDECVNRFLVNEPEDEGDPDLEDKLSSSVEYFSRRNSVLRIPIPPHKQCCF